MRASRADLYFATPWQKSYSPPLCRDDMICDILVFEMRPWNITTCDIIVAEMGLWIVTTCDILVAEMGPGL